MLLRATTPASRSDYGGVASHAASQGRLYSMVVPIFSGRGLALSLPPLQRGEASVSEQGENVMRFLSLLFSVCAKNFLFFTKD